MYWLIGFPQVASGQLFGKDKNPDEFSLKCETNNLVQLKVKIYIFVSINQKKKTILLYGGNWADPREFKITKMGEGIIKGWGLNNNDKRYHTIRLNRYNGRMEFVYGCKNQNVDDTFCKNQIRYDNCQVVERKF